MKNKVISLSGNLVGRSHPAGFGKPSLGKNTLTSLRLQTLLEGLEQTRDFFDTRPLIDGILLKAVMSRVVPKSKRLDMLLTFGKEKANDLIRGIAFKSEGDSKKHVFTYFLTKGKLTTVIERVSLVKRVIDESFGGILTQDDLQRLEDISPECGLAKMTLVKYAVECAFVERFSYENDIDEIQQSSIVSFYKTGRPIKDILADLGVKVRDENFLSDSTAVLSNEEIRKVIKKAPFLVSMADEDLAAVPPISSGNVFDQETPSKLPPHQFEPIVGVIDTFFDKKCYFSSYVDYHPVSEEIDEIASYEDRIHGTEVSSIIVDGPSLNPKLDDGCGRFRVRHFGIAGREGAVVSSLIKKLRKIVEENKDIKVWNLSLGEYPPCPENHISFLAAEIDELQKRYNVLFVISGSNSKTHQPYRIGSPADSINSIVVNSVKRNGEPASYSRSGPVLSFFLKPDVSYYGGDKDEKIVVAGPDGKRLKSGTSFAAPWIARKAAYLIYRMGLSREATKALIVHAAVKWGRAKDKNLIGYGIVPVKISDILETDNDEIRFVITGVSDSYETYSYDIPVPIKNSAYPYRARATLCYFPKCHIEQGVDYTESELDVHLGRINSKEEKIVSINDNYQDEIGDYTEEAEARNIYRKWDNVKNIAEVDGVAYRPKKMLGSRFWGFSIKRKNRIDSPLRGERIQFALVVSLKCLDKINRYDDFVSSLEASGSFAVKKLDYDLVNRVLVEEDSNVDFDD